MALTLQPLTLDVNVKDIVSKIEESSAGPVINLGISVKLSISELLQALQQYQQKSHDPATVPAPPVNGASLLLSPVPNDPTPLAPPVFQSAFSASAVSWEPPNASAAMRLAENITWDTEISHLQPGNGDYASKWAEQEADEGSVLLPKVQPGQWEALSSSRKWILADEAPLLKNLRVTRLKAAPLVKKAPTPKTTNLINLKAIATDKFDEAAKVVAGYLSAKAIAKADNTPAWLRSPPGGPPPAPPAAASPPAKQAPPGAPATTSRAEGTESAKGAGVARAPLSSPPPVTAASLAARPNGPPPGLPPPKPPPPAPKVAAPPGLKAPKSTATPAVGKAAPPLAGKAASPQVGAEAGSPVAEEKPEDGKTCKQQ